MSLALDIKEKIAFAYAGVVICLAGYGIAGLTAIKHPNLKFIQTAFMGLGLAYLSIGSVVPAWLIFRKPS